MEPKVCGGLLMHHRRGNGFDVDALRDRTPLWQIIGKGSKIGSHGNRGFRRWKSIFWLFLVSREYLGIYWPKNRVRRSTMGPQARGAPPQGVPRWLVTTRQVSCLHLQVWQVSFGPRKLIPKILFCLDSV